MKQIIYLILFIPLTMFGQDDLLSEIQIDEGNKEVSAVFKSLKIVNFESTKLQAKGELLFNVSHRFGSIDGGFDTFFGLDDAVTRIQFIYGINDWLSAGVSRSSFQKVYEASLKYRFVKQSDSFPFTIVGFNSFMINTALDENNLPGLEFNDRISYATQLLISRKFNDKLSLEFIPSYFHDNFVSVDTQENSQFALGIGGRYKIGKRWSLNADYGYHLNRSEDSPFKNPFSIGVDVETGGHVFQMHLTNSQAMNVNGFLGQATGDWSEGVIFFGFNLTRNF